MKLSPTEEKLMDLIWQHEKVFMKGLLDAFPEPKPATTTLATLLKRMQDKGFVGYTLYGNSRQYFPLVKRSDYFSQQVNHMIHNYFGNSHLQFASFFTQTSDLSSEELEDLKKIIEQEIEKKNP